MKKTIALVYDALQWAFHTFAQHWLLFVKLIVLSGAITLAATLLTLGMAAFFVPFYMTLCFINIALKLYEGEPVQGVEDFFVGFKPFVKGFAAFFIYGVIVIAGLLLFVIPGIYIASRFYYIIYCIMDQQSGVIESFKCSKRLTASLPWHGFLLLCCATILGSVWFLLPVAALMNVYAYKQSKQTYI
jgi:hypothetical protein